MKPNFRLLMLGLLLQYAVVIHAQTDVTLLRDLAEENKKSVEALALYPTETRLAILEATKTPEVIIKMQDMREKTSAAFRTLIEDFPQSTQMVFYNLSRYPGLIEAVVAQRNDAGALRKSLEILPEDKQEDAFGVITRQMATMQQVNDLNQTTRNAFERLIARYPVAARNAFEHLLGLPEVIDLLNEDLRFTILVGETYSDNPAWVIHKMDSLNLAVARSHAEELDSWKSSLDQDPEAKAELQSAANEYATEYGYNANEDNDDLYRENDRSNPIIIHHYYDPYPYWYGYPWWEPYPRWRPYPWWWDWGYNFYPYGPQIVYLPSYHFVHWYFDHPHHHNHYNHLSTHFVNHYYGHRNSGTTITSGVREWQRQNRTVISDEFLADKGRLPARLKEYGRFETGRQEFNAKNPSRMVSPEGYLDKNTQKYPEIQRSRIAAKAEIQQEDAVKKEKRSNWAPAKAPAKPEPAPSPKPVRPPRLDPNPNAKPPRTIQPPVREPVKTDKPNAPAATKPPRTQPEEAKDYHRQEWEGRKPAQSTPQINRRNTPAPLPKRENPAPKEIGRKPEKTAKTGGRNR